jgi:hypothetical protein
MRYLTFTIRELKFSYVSNIFSRKCLWHMSTSAPGFLKINSKTYFGTQKNMKLNTHMHIPISKVQ